MQPLLKPIAEVSCRPSLVSSQLSARERGLTTALLGLGLITFAIDASNTTLVLPQIMTSLRVEVFQIHWLLTAPGIVRTVVTAATGWLSGWFGPRTLYLLCIGSMTVGSLGSMLAWDWPSLIFFRMLSGAGGGLIPQISQAIFYQIFPPGKRGMAWVCPDGVVDRPGVGLYGGNLLGSPPGACIRHHPAPCGLGSSGLVVVAEPASRATAPGLLWRLITVLVSTLLLALSQGNREAGTHSIS
jgi:MFS family permease